MNRKSIGFALATFLLAAPGCAGPKQTVRLEPKEQEGAAEVDVKTASVTSEREGVVVKVQAAVLPGYDDDKSRPAFWVTVNNNRASKIVIKPASTRLIDTFGNQIKPQPMMVDNDPDHPYRYVNVDPQVHFFFSVNHGWPYYPFYPYHGWYGHSRYHRRWYRPWYGPRYYDPFWGWGMGTYYSPYWVRRVVPVDRAGKQLEKEETVYQGAKMTFAVLFPQLGELVREVRLIVPEVTLYEDGRELKSIDFELVFDQIIEVKEK